jgi:hypothetical protein
MPDCRLSEPATQLRFASTLFEEMMAKLVRECEVQSSLVPRPTQLDDRRYRGAPVLPFLDHFRPFDRDPS